MKKVILVLFALLYQPVASQAEDHRGSQRFTMVGGGLASSGIYGGLQYAYFPEKTPTLGIGLELSRIPNQLEWDSKTVMALVEMRLSRPKGLWRPFLFGGIGAHRTHNRVIGGPWGSLNSFPNPWPDNGTLESRTLIDDSATSWAIAWGMGMDLFVTDHIFIGSELRETVLGPTRFSATDSGRLVGAMTSYPATPRVELLIRAGFKWE